VRCSGKCTGAYSQSRHWLSRDLPLAARLR
jgi:hypothetical protein